MVGHSAKACPKLQRRALEKASQKKAGTNQTSDTWSESGTSTTASGDSWTSGAWRKPRRVKSKAKGASGEWQPEHWVLSTEEEREATARVTIHKRRERDTSKPEHNKSHMNEHEK